jgi:endonuclease-3 related protein
VNDSGNRHIRESLLDIYSILLSRFGPRYWWPAETREEVILGAVLAQNTSWNNVKKAISALRSAKCLTFKAIDRTDINRLADLIRPSRFMNQKAQTLKVFTHYLKERYRYDLQKMKQVDLPLLRAELLSLHRIGPETADSILLYALEKSVFVIDAYTKRIFSRHGFLDRDDSYDTYQRLFMDNLPQDVKLYNEYHALLVHTGYRYCKPKPLCEDCPLATFGDNYQGAQE